MLEKGKTYAYYYSANERGTDVTIVNISNGVAIASSGNVGDIGPFTMHFDAATGEGLNDYTGTHLEPLS